MRYLLTAAALAALSSTPFSAFGDDDEEARDAAAQPEPSEATPHHAEPPPPVASRPLGPEQTLGFQVRLGGVDTDRALVGAALVATSGPIELGFGTDLVFDVTGEGRYHHRDSDDGWDGWCHTSSNGRCTARGDAAFTAFAGLLQRTPPVFAGSRLRLDLLGEVGWQVSHVSERTETGGFETWSDAARAYPIVGVRASAGVHVLRAGYFSVGGFVRQSLRKRMCVTTDGGCTHVGGTMAGLVVSGGMDFGAHR